MEMGLLLCLTDRVFQLMLAFRMVKGKKGNGKLGNRKIGQRKKSVIGINGNICVTAEKTATGKLGNGKKGNRRIAYWMNE